MYHIFNKAGQEVGTAHSYQGAYQIALKKGDGKVDIRWKGESSQHHFTRI